MNVKVMSKPLFAIAAMIFAAGVGAQSAGTGAQTPATSDSTAEMGTTHASGVNTRPTRNVVRYVDDKTISAKINAEFLADSDLKAGDVKVRTYKGVVTLSGHATSQQQIHTAMQKVHTVDGVKAVRDHIKIAPAS
jgi:osmotically-inducible protein OsmY